ncbi:beta-N-acetylglucosaminidase [Bacteroides sp. 214]|uniref:glycoside hydrolase family 3 N-terminal domain-containing protein n=1 Tax=Bacteroides sp. 214 TaxID=2302935 RepID=UPI0013D7E1DA|nr:glycoside hydrolase family 3 N-terminal domain-containing protein [Bacteroides sp. 214]NDW13113.1 beta-N-acetylglucosaminidase [Bacteroides sp. 214]
MKKNVLLAVLCGCFLTLKAQQQSVFMCKDNNEAASRWVNETLGRMNLKEKVGQLMVYTISPFGDAKTKKRAQEVIKKYKIGGVLYYKGTIEGQANLTNYMQALSTIPLMVTFDGEWGLAMRLQDAPDYPKAAALGCIQNNELLFEYGQEVARQFKELGVHVNFAPVADVNTNPKNPVIHHRSFGEDPKKVAEKVVAYARGLESAGILSVTKHFPGHGDTDTDSHLSAPWVSYPRAHLDTVELHPFKTAIDAGLGGVMVGHLKVTALESDRSIVSSLSHNIITKLLKEELGFKGLVFTDAMEMKGVCDIPQCNAKAVKAGNDMILVSKDIETAQREILDAVKQGEISEEEIDEKCRKILTYKYMMGLDNRPVSINPNTIKEQINTPTARSLETRLRQEAVTVLGNHGNVLPLEAVEGGIAVLNVGEAGSSIPFIETMQKFATVTTFQLSKDTPEAQCNSIKTELSKYRRVVIAYTGSDKNTQEYEGFLNNLDLPRSSVVYVFFTSYRAAVQLVTAQRKSSATVLAHSGQTDIQQHVANVLFAKAPANGKTSMSIGDLYQRDEGVTITTDMLPQSTPEDLGLKSYIFNKGVDSLLRTAVAEKVFPGCQVLLLKGGRVVYEKAMGTHTYQGTTLVRSTDLFDLAELTQTTGTLLAIMKLFDEGKLALNDKVSTYLPFLRSTNKKDITIRELLLHQSGLQPYMRFSKGLIDQRSVPGPFMQGFVDDWHYTRVGYYTYACATFKFKAGLVAENYMPSHTLHMADGMWLSNDFKANMMSTFDKSQLGKKNYVYCSDAFILLQQVVEKLVDDSIDHYLEQTFYQPMGLVRTKYLPLRFFDKDEIMPTVANDYLRRQDLHGHVHDESAACLGGVSGNAGLFSTANEVGQVYQMLLNGGVLHGKRYFSEETCALFTTEQSTLSRRGLGFDKPDKQDAIANPCAPSAPAEVYGHTGFTGTCAWVDPTRQLVYVFLSNSVCPDVWNDKLVTMKLREQIQELIYKSME